MPTNEFLSNEPPAHPLSASFHKQQRRKTLQSLGLFLCVNLLMMLAVLLTACASPPTQQCEPLPIPPMPALTQTLPQTDYSLSVAASIKRWASELTGTSTTSKP